MEKRLKYLIGCLVVGFGLLFNQSFGLDVELIDGGQSQYLVEFKNYAGTTYGGSYIYRYLYYNLSYNNSYNKINIQPYYNPSSCSNDSCSIFTFNNSIYLFSGFDSSIYNYTSSSRHPKNTSTYTAGTLSNSPQIVLGTQNSVNQGQAFVCVDCFNTVVTQNPKFGLGSGFILSDSYKLVGSNESSYFRLYNEFHTGFDVNSVDFNTMSGGGFPFDSWEYFTHSQTRTSYGRIANRGYIFSYIGSYRGIGYSYIYSYDLYNSGTITRSNLQFRTMYDQVVAPLKLMASNNQWILLDSDLSGFYYDGVLVLPIYSYNSGLNYGQYIIAKDPNNTQRILYEMYSCNNNNVESVWSGGGTEFCAKLDAGYLTYDGSTNVLPFTDSNTEFSVNYSPDFYPLLTDLTQNLRLSTETVSAGFKIGNHVYGFQTDPNVDIQESLKMFNPGNEIEYKNKCLTDTGFLLNNFDFCSIFFPDGVPTQVPGTDDQYINIGYDENGNPIIWVTYQEDLVNQMSGYTWTQDSGGNWYLSCTSDSCDPNINSGVISTGNAGASDLTTRYNDFFDHGMFFSCPFSYNNQNGLKITEQKILSNIGNKILYPINCMIAGYRYGSQFSFLGSGGQVLENRLLNSDDYKGLYNFLDILLSMGILFFAFKIYSLIK